MSCKLDRACTCIGNEPLGCKNFSNTGAVPPTLGPMSEAGGAKTPPAEAFPAADFHIAQRALNEIRLGLAFVREVVSTLPAEAEVRVPTANMRTMMRTIVTRLKNAERACLQLGLPF